MEKPTDAMAAATEFDAKSPLFVVMRGISGSGKSTVTRALVAAAVAQGVPYCVASADDFFIKADGVYHFDPAELKNAHQSCMRKVEVAVRSSVPLIILDNTNTMAWEYAEYLQVVSQVNAARTPKPWLSLFRAGSSAGGAGGASPKSPPAPAPAPAPASLGAVYRLRVCEIGCPTAAHLKLFSVRNSHGVPWEGVTRQWLRWEADPRAIIVPPYINPDKEAPLLITYASMPEVQAVQRAKDAGWKEMPPAQASNQSNRGSHNHGAHGAASARHTSGNNSRTGNSGGGGTGSALLGGSPLARSSNSSSRGGGGSGGGRRRGSSGASSQLSSGSNLVAAPWLPHVLYVGLFLDQPSRTALWRAVRPRYGTVYADHVTVVHEPTARDFTPELAACVGTYVTFYAVAQAYGGEGVQAVQVAWEAPTTGAAAADDADEGEGEAEGSAAVAAAMDAEDDGTGPPPAVDSSGTVRPVDPGNDGDTGVSSGGSGGGAGSGGSGTPTQSSSRERLRAALACFAGGGMSKNGIAHVTVSGDRGVSPAASNAMLAAAAQSGRLRPLRRGPLLLRARLGVVIKSGGGRREFLLKRRDWQDWLASFE